MKLTKRNIQIVSASLGIIAGAAQIFVEVKRLKTLLKGN